MWQTKSRARSRSVPLYYFEVTNEMFYKGIHMKFRQLLSIHLSKIGNTKTFDRNGKDLRYCDFTFMFPI